MQHDIGCPISITLLSTSDDRATAVPSPNAIALCPAAHCATGVAHRRSGGAERIILSAGGAESMILSARTESIILSVPPTESMMLSA